MQYKYLITNIAFVLTGINACTQNTFDEKLKSIYRNSVPFINSDDLAQLIENDTDIIILDIRSKAEYAVSHIKGARFVNYDSFSIKEIQDIPKDRQIIIHCSIGYRSERVGEKMLEYGYQHVRNLYGGIFDWVNNKYPVYDNNQQQTDKIHAYSKKWGKWLTHGEKVYK